jgi:DUF4097 and DUF4098 domain-containing protein YvlB
MRYGVVLAMAGILVFCGYAQGEEKGAGKAEGPPERWAPPVEGEAPKESAEKLKEQEERMKAQEVKAERKSSMETADGKPVKTEEVSFEFSSGSRLVMDGFEGSIKVQGSEEEKCVIKGRMAAVKGVKKAEELLEKVRLVAKRSGETVWVEVEGPAEIVEGRSLKANLEVTVPKKARLRLNPAAGSMDVRGVEGAVDCETGNGDITASGIAGRFRGRLNFGEVVVKGADFTKGVIWVNNCPVTCTEVRGDLEIKTNSGDVKVVYVKDAPGTCDISVSTNDGDIDVTVPAGFSGALEVSTVVGKIESDYKLEATSVSGRRMKGTIGEGKGKLYLRSSLGSIQIRKNAAEQEGKPLAGKESAAVEAAMGWLKHTDAGDYQKGWEEAAGFLKGAVSKEAFAQSVGGIRGPLGKVISRKVKSKQYMTQVPGAPDGEYVMIQFETVFEKKKSAVETVTPMLDADGVWRVSGYYIR